MTLRDARPFETEREVVREHVRLDRMGEINREIDTFELPPRLEELLGEYEGLFYEYITRESDHVLKIAGNLCMQRGQADLWREIFTAALDGSEVNPDDELRFLDRSIGR